MIPQDQPHVYEAGLQALSALRRLKVRGRFVAIYLGLRRMRDEIAPLGADRSTPTKDIERLLDDMFTKTHRPEPLVVLTAPFGGSTSPNAGYSTRSGAGAPGNATSTNTWRNNFGIQKGIGCPAEPDLIDDLLHEEAIRLACPHMRHDPDGQYVCSIENATYRGDEHSIWLRRTNDGYQVVDLDLPNVYDEYLRPDGNLIPLFALIAVLYSFAPATIYPARDRVGIPDFAVDFRFTLAQVEEIFDIDPESEGNAAVLQATLEVAEPPPAPDDAPAEAPRELPPEADPIVMNTGLGAERLVAEELVRHGWTVRYRGNQRGVGYDLQAERTDQTLHVEVKSSVSVTSPELTEAEWEAAQALGESYVLAVVDFHGSERRRVWYVRDPAGTASTTERSVSVFRLQRASIEPLGTEAEFL